MDIEVENDIKVASIAKVREADEKGPEETASEEIEETGRRDRRKITYKFTQLFCC